MTNTIKAVSMKPKQPRNAEEKGWEMKSEILTIEEVAEDLCCSKAHVYNMVNGRVAGVTPFPAIVMGRRKIVKRSSLERWKCVNEQDGLVSSPGQDRQLG